MRITPACAGKSSSMYSDFWHAVGSPPRVRGKGRCHHLVIFVHGITPACAGKRYCNCFAQVVNGDHPRVCGEKLMASFNVESVEGSPPRVRGKV